MRLDTATLCAALLHDTVEDTTADLDEVREAFGDEVAGLVDGVTKLTGIVFQSRDEAQAENYRKMMVAMATDIRVILIKLADRLHNMRTIDAMPKQKQIDKAKETLEIYAPRAPPRHPRDQVGARGPRVRDAAPAQVPGDQGPGQPAARGARALRGQGRRLPHKELEALGIRAEISGRAKHFYSIYSKMTRKGREFNEIYDLTAMRVIVDSVKDCYGAVGVIHSLWKPLPGRFKDMVAMPKFNMYQALHDRDRARGAAAGDPDPHARDITRRPSTASPRTGATRRATRPRASRPTRRSPSCSGSSRCSTGTRRPTTPSSPTSCAGS